MPYMHRTFSSATIEEISFNGDFFRDFKVLKRLSGSIADIEHSM